MKINPLLFGVAAALAAAVLWSVYSFCAISLLIIAINLSGDLAYTNFGNFEWTNFLSRFLVDLVALSLGAGLTGWLIAGFYNYLNENSAPKLP